MTTEPATIPEGDELARQTAQAKLLREARDQLAEKARKLAEKKDRKGLERMGLTTVRALAMIDGAQFTTEDMAELLGVSLKALLKWLSPADNADHREMPKTARLLLARILKD